MTAPALSVSTENGRYYVRPDRGDSVPSVTNIIGKKDKPGLKWWAAKEVATYAAANRTELAAMTEEQAFSVVRYVPFRHSDESPAAIGDIVHSWVERYIKGEGPEGPEVHEAHQTAQWMYGRWLKFCEHYRPEFTGSEFTVWSDKYGYAGTADFSCRIAGVHILADTKTGKGVYPDTAMQLAALAHADYMIDQDGNESALPKYDRYAILHLRPRSFTLYPVEKIEEAFQCFLALKAVFDWELNHAPSSIAFAPKHN